MYTTRDHPSTFRKQPLLIPNPKPPTLHSEACNPSQQCVTLNPNPCSACTGVTSAST